MHAFAQQMGIENRPDLPPLQMCAPNSESGNDSDMDDENGAHFGSILAIFRIFT
jgi:hypothetical protein